MLLTPYGLRELLTATVIAAALIVLFVRLDLWWAVTAVSRG